MTTAKDMCRSRLCDVSMKQASCSGLWTGGPTVCTFRSSRLRGSRRIRWLRLRFYGRDLRVLTICLL